MHPPDPTDCLGRRACLLTRLCCQCRFLAQLFGVPGPTPMLQSEIHVEVHPPASSGGGPVLRFGHNPYAGGAPGETLGAGTVPVGNKFSASMQQAGNFAVFSCRGLPGVCQHSCACLLCTDLWSTARCGLASPACRQGQCVPRCAWLPATVDKSSHRPVRLPCRAREGGCGGGGHLPPRRAGEEPGPRITGPHHSPAHRGQGLPPPTLATLSRI